MALTAAYAFPWLSRFQNDTVTTIKNAFLLSAAYLPRSLVILALNLAPFAVLLLDTYTFLGLGLLWLTIWFSGTAYLNCLLLQKVFAPYLGTPQ